MSTTEEKTCEEEHSASASASEPSATESSSEAMPPEYRELARDMFGKITEYLNGELSG